MIWFLRALPINCQALGGALAYLYTISTVSPSSDSGLLEYTLADNFQNCPKNNLGVVYDQNKGFVMIQKVRFLKSFSTELIL